jgi:ABC-type glycerol-3-phosphate transport system substrate-binding protein
MEGTTYRSRVAIAVVIVALVAASCGGADETTESTSATGSPVTESTTASSTPPDREDRDFSSLPERVPADDDGVSVTGEVPQELLTPVVADAASRAGVEASAVAVITAQEMMWPDGSLGCAEPGGIYTQAIVPGYWVIVEAGGIAYDYRLDDAGSFTLCTSPLPAPGDTVPDS